jgi:hypothetical protein
VNDASTGVEASDGLVGVGEGPSVGVAVGISVGVCDGVLVGVKVEVGDGVNVQASMRLKLWLFQRVRPALTVAVAVLLAVLVIEGDGVRVTCEWDDADCVELGGRPKPAPRFS